MSLLDHDAVYWVIGVLLAIVGLLKLAQRRREHLVGLLREYVVKHQKVAESQKE